MKKVIRLNENDIEKLVKKILNEGNKKSPCWKGYEAVGMKNKGGKKVPNCVPIKEDIEESEESSEHESNNYMFWQNLQTIKEVVDGILEMNQEEVDEMLSNGHGWAIDHISTSADDIEEVYHFLEGNENEKEYEGDMKKEYEAYHENRKKRNRI